MPDEKRQREQIRRIAFYGDEGVFWVKESDYLDALGEAEKKLTEEQQRIAISRNRISALEEDLEEADGKLESLRSGLKAEVERLRGMAWKEREERRKYAEQMSPDNMHGLNAAVCMGSEYAYNKSADRLSRLFDASGDTEKQSGAGEDRG
jgi:septal ring factor EnvC (AmiA/AmiB activator)